MPGGDLLIALEELLRDAVAGDPVTGLKWTHKSTRRLSAALRRRGFSVSPNTVARLLRDGSYTDAIGRRLYSLAAELGIEGPEIGEKLAELEAAQYAGEISDRDGALGLLRG